MDKKTKARDLIKKMVKKGLIRKASDFPCSSCGISRNDDPNILIDYHHEDYDSPIEVIPLCRKCHVRRDRELHPELHDNKDQLAAALAKRWKDPKQHEAQSRLNSERVWSEESLRKMSESARNRHKFK